MPTATDSFLSSSDMRTAAMLHAARLMWWPYCVQAGAASELTVRQGAAVAMRARAPRSGVRCARRAAAYVAAVAAVLRLAPVGGACLAGDDDDLRARRQLLLLVQLRRHEQRPHRTDVDLIDRTLDIEVVERVRMVGKIAGVVDDDVDRRVERRRHLLHRALQRHIDARDHHHACGIELGPSPRLPPVSSTRSPFRYEPSYTVLMSRYREFFSALARANRATWSGIE
eukprot:6017331-Prymnesium_polylepis.2